VGGIPFQESNGSGKVIATGGSRDEGIGSSNQWGRLSIFKSREGSQTKIVAKGCNHTCITTQAPVTVDGESGFAFFEEAIEAVIVTFTGGNARFFEACQQFKSLDEGVVVQVGGNAVFSKPNKRHA